MQAVSTCAPGTPIEVWFQDEMRVGQKNGLTYQWAKKGICTNDGCDYTTDVEPDQDRGWCEVCGTNLVKSAPVLAGII